MLWGFSVLKDEQMKAIAELEEKLDITLLAFSGINIKNAEITTDDLEQIKKLESDLGLSLVAVKVE
ncbi:hypothetical protein RE476_00010 [Methanolobus mangrovi]|uniref:Uncharacterized protein n=1 Tax=Methanolobus mangrovi TaxID=3072977 RepID=A0AA51UFF6_9EURY|nr:hypothetical protein [Methanolobus mangrovi]WMW22244.1 hypothetical protein RE476_00010 [Methanolobus mangrovi]